MIVEKSPSRSLLPNLLRLVRHGPWRANWMSRPQGGHTCPSYCRDQRNAQPDRETCKHLPSARELVFRKRLRCSFRADNGFCRAPKLSPPCISLLAVFTFPLSLTFVVFVGHLYASLALFISKFLNDLGEKLL